VILNVILVLFTFMIIMTEGGSSDIAYNIFGILLFLVPLLNVVLISRMGFFNPARSALRSQDTVAIQGKSSDTDTMNGTVRNLAILLNLILLGFGIRAIVRAYPHPEEDGVLEYTILVLATPILSLIVYFRAKVTGKTMEAQGPEVHA
jgi:hypothetical protein